MLEPLLTVARLKEGGRKGLYLTRETGKPGRSDIIAELPGFLLPTVAQRQALVEAWTARGHVLSKDEVVALLGVTPPKPWF